MRKAEEDDFDDGEGPRLEEKYMRLFMKIGRDFVHKDDLAIILSKEVISLIDPDILANIDLYSLSGARDRAEEYREYLATGQLGSSVYSDLIDLSED